jgi:protein-S-isoprenylcysteine O-methyltransferase Ste14
VIIKFLLVPALVFAVWLSLRSRASLRGQARRKILAGLTVVVGVLAVIFPAMAQWAADRVGVTRGTDLLLYFLALVLIYLVGSTSVRSVSRRRGWCASPGRWLSPRPRPAWAWGRHPGTTRRRVSVPASPRRASCTGRSRPIVRPVQHEK